METARSGGGIGRWLAPARSLAFLAVFAGVLVALTWAGAGRNISERIVLAFDAGALVFLLSLIPLLRDTDPADIRRHARANDANRVLVLVLTTILGIAAMAAIGGELHGAARGDPSAIARLVLTLVLIWLLANSVYTLHYAHAYYSAGPAGMDAGGLDFPGTDAPDYWDFAYFAFTLGMTFQTSDVAIRTPALRKAALAHTAAAFVFNMGVVAFTVNVLGGLA